MDKIKELMNKIKTLMKTREAELKENRLNNKELIEDKKILISNKNELDSQLESKKLLKEEVEKSSNQVIEEKMGAIFLSTLSLCLITLLSIIFFRGMLEFSLLKSILTTIAVSLISSPLVIKNEFKEYKNIKQFLENNSLENILRDLQELEKEKEIIEKKLILNDKKTEGLKDRYFEIYKELGNLKYDYDILKGVKKQVIDGNFKDDEHLKKVLDGFCKEQTQQFEINLNFQKVKK